MCVCVLSSRLYFDLRRRVAKRIPAVGKEGLEAVGGSSRGLIVRLSAGRRSKSVILAVSYSSTDGVSKRVSTVEKISPWSAIFEVFCRRQRKGFT